LTDFLPVDNKAFAIRMYLLLECAKPYENRNVINMIYKKVALTYMHNRIVPQ